MPHLSPIAWVFLYVSVWACFMCALAWAEYLKFDLR